MFYHIAFHEIYHSISRVSARELDIKQRKGKPQRKKMTGGQEYSGLSYQRYSVTESIYNQIDRFTWLNETITQLLTIIHTLIKFRNVGSFLAKECTTTQELFLTAFYRLLPPDFPPAYYDEIEAVFTITQEMSKQDQEKFWKNILKAYFVDGETEQSINNFRQVSALIRKYFGDGALVHFDQHYTSLEEDRKNKDQGNKSSLPSLTTFIKNTRKDYLSLLENNQAD